MVFHDPKSTSVDDFQSVQDLAGIDQVEVATRASKLQQQRERIQRLDAYYGQTIAEIRASLDSHQEESNSNWFAVSSETA
jgi:hypothetical protein